MKKKLEPINGLEIKKPLITYNANPIKLWVITISIIGTFIISLISLWR